MSHQAAIYDVISDGKTSLRIGGDIDHDFAIGLHADANVGIRSVLSFMVDTVSANNLQFRLQIINGSNVTTNVATYTTSNVATYTTSSTFARVFQEVISANVFTLTGNTLRVTVLSGSGTLEISDIVLLYQRNL